MQHLCGHYGLAFMMVIRVLYTVGDIQVYVIYYSESTICARHPIAVRDFLLTAAAGYLFHILEYFLWDT
jgi:hypothetical protein